MRIAAILPHLKQFGGVRRFLEIGNVFINRGHGFVVFLPGREKCEWFDYKGGIAYCGPGNTLSEEDLRLDVLLIGDPPSFPLLDHFDCPSYVWVIAGGNFASQYRQFYESQDGQKSQWLVNNRVFVPEYPGARLVEGGVNTRHFERTRALKVGYYAGRGDSKGENHIRKQLLRFPDKGFGVVLHPIEGFDNGDLPEAYSELDYFVTWEQRPGWSNTAAEALACGVPVITNGVNCEPFIDRCIVVDNLRDFFMNPMAPWSWERVCDRLEEIWREDGIL